MSRKGTPLDNAVIESFLARLKNEVMYNKEFQNIDELKQAILSTFGSIITEESKESEKLLNI